MPWLSVQEIQTHQTRYISSDDLDRLMAPFYGKNMIAIIFTGAVQKTLMAEYSAIKQVQVKWESRQQLSVKITEKAPWMAFWSDGKSVIISEDGDILSDESDVIVDEISSLHLVKGVPVFSVEERHIDPSAFQRIKNVIQLTERYFEPGSIQLDFESEENWTLRHHETRELLLGNLEHLETKLDAYTAFQRQVSGKKASQITYVDLRIPGKLVVNYGKK
ncbi:MAG: hypothetical protein CL521_03200 [Actinobacteria bacterium]|nr:hypothetical protein [Actinomycetota bacterium]